MSKLVAENFQILGKKNSRAFGAKSSCVALALSASHCVKKYCSIRRPRSKEGFLAAIFEKICPKLKK